MHVHHVHHSSRARVTVLSLQTSLSVTRNMNVTVAKELYKYFPKCPNFDTGNFSLTPSIILVYPVNCSSYHTNIVSNTIHASIPCIKRFIYINKNCFLQNGVWEVVAYKNVC